MSAGSLSALGTYSPGGMTSVNVKIIGSGESSALERANTTEHTNTALAKIIKSFFRFIHGFTSCIINLQRYNELFFPKTILTHVYLHVFPFCMYHVCPFFHFIKDTPHTPATL